MNMASMSYGTTHKTQSTADSLNTSRVWRLAGKAVAPMPSSV